MDRINKFLMSLVICGIVILCVGTSFIPSTGGTVPPGVDPDDFNKQQQAAVYSSIGFKITMVATGITGLSILTIWIRTCNIDYREDTREIKDSRVKSILKVKRTSVLPEPKISVEDPKPVVNTSPPITSIPAPSSSVSPQLVPLYYSRPVIQKIKMNPQLREALKYPPPYDGINVR